MKKNYPDYYNDLDKVYSKIWELINSGYSDRDAPFHIPVFIYGDGKNRPNKTGRSQHDVEKVDDCKLLTKNH